MVKAVQARRHNHDEFNLIPLDLTFLYSPPVTDGWSSILGAVATKTGLTTDIREIAICRVALINEPWFEWSPQLPIFERAIETQDNVAEKLENIEKVKPTDKAPLSGIQ